MQVGDLHSVLPGDIRSRASADNLSIWLPKSGDNLVNRWKAGFYQYLLPIADWPNVSALLVERPAAPLIENIEGERNQSFIMLSGIAFVSILATFLLSRILIQPLTRLDKASRYLPEKNTLSSQCRAASKPSGGICCYVLITARYELCA